MNPNEERVDRALVTLREEILAVWGWRIFDVNITTPLRPTPEL